MSAVISPAVIEGDGDLELDVHDYMISQPLAIIGIRWIGKSYEAGKMCEQLCEVKQPFVVIDPEGEYWTLKERYPVIVAAAVPLAIEAGVVTYSYGKSKGWWK